MYINCDLFLDSFNAEHCAFSSVCTEENCPFVLKTKVEELEDLQEELKTNENELIEITNLYEEQKIQIEDLEQQIEKKEEEIKDLRMQIENLIIYIQEKYDTNFTCTLEILNGNV